MASPITKSGVNQLSLPDMLLYYKNKDGDDKYLKGMYELGAQILDASTFNLPGVYSIYVTMENNRVEPAIIIGNGMPSEDIVDKIYLGSFLVDRNHEIMEDFVFTIPDIAYTGDRGLFYVNGGQANGLNLTAGSTHNKRVNRKEGYYYDEGINYPTGPIENYPVNVDNGSNYNLKYYSNESPIETVYYFAPSQGLTYDISASTGLVTDKYWNTANQTLDNVEEGHYTIQQHFVTPNGQNIILYGTKVYNSIDDAISNINTVFGSDISFPYVEATRIVVGNVQNFDSSNESHVRYYAMNRLAQVGTISPTFADNQFVLYDGSTVDTTPVSMQFNLDTLGADYDTSLGYYRLNILPYDTERKLFGLSQKYITDSSVLNVDETDEDERTYPSPGYFLADQKDLEYAEDRIANIEAEIWKPYDALAPRYEQGLRKRMYDVEDRLDADEVIISDHETRITSNEQNKVNKTTMINGYRLGDTTLANEAKNINLVTGDIAEGAPTGGTVNLWFTQARVSSNQDVTAARNHVGTTSASDNALGHVKVNPHNLSTDDINYLMDTTKIFVTPEEERRIRADKLPDNTIQALADLDAKNMDNIPVTKLGGNRDNPTGVRTNLGNFKKLEFYEDGVDLDVSSNGETLTMNIKGQIGNDVMTKSRYATYEAEYPGLYDGYVDTSIRSLFSGSIEGMEEATASQYYGTNSSGTIGIHDLPTYVGTVNQSSFASIDQIIFTPVDGSIQERHLQTSLANKINNNYHSIYDGGTLKSDEINTIAFGNNLTVTVNGHTATINATSSGGQADNKFATLDDVDVVYTGNEGKTLVINSTGTGITVANTPSTADFMRKSVYVSGTDATKVKKAVQADNATLAASATNALAVNNKVVDDTDNTVASL